DVGTFGASEPDSTSTPHRSTHRPGVTKAPCSCWTCSASAGSPRSSACQAGIGAGSYVLENETVVSVTSTSSGGGELRNTGGAIKGSTTATWVISAKFSWSSSRSASVSQTSPSVAQPGSLSHGVTGGGRRPASDGSPSQAHTNTPSSWTGYARTRAPTGISPCVGTWTQKPRGS